MDPAATATDAPPKDPLLPKLFRVGNLIAPRAPHDIPSAGLEERTLTDLAVKLRLHRRPALRPSGWPRSSTCRCR